MNEEQKWLLATAISLLAALLTMPTIIGPIFFGLLAIGFIVKWQTVKNDGQKPWWSKSVVTMWRERGE